MANNMRNALQPVRPNTFDKTPLRDSGEVFTAYRNLPVHVRGDQPGDVLHGSIKYGYWPTNYFRVSADQLLQEEERVISQERCVESTQERVITVPRERIVEKPVDRVK
jgi:hypothetical protein